MSEISFDTYISCVKQCKDDYKKYSQQFDNIDENVDNLVDRFTNEGLKYGDKVCHFIKMFTFENMGINEVYSYIADKELFEQELTIDSNKYSSAINHSESLFLDIKSLVKNISLDNEEILNKEDEKGDTKRFYPKVNPLIKHCRQTLKPFVIMIMKDKSQYSCIGCKETITLQVPYFRHLEEYPAGSKLMKPYSYHINRDCLCISGFNDDYLRNITVRCSGEISSSIMARLEDIGFISKNIQMNIDSDSESDSQETMPEQSGVYNPTVRFVYRLKNAKQKEIICFGCQTEIIPDSFLTRGQKFDQPFHINKKCILMDGMLSNNFSRVKCQVFQLLRNHGELKELLACGFYSKNIIGYKPPNPNLEYSGSESDLSKTDTQHQGVSSEHSSTVMFFYRHKNANQKKKIICLGCQSEIVPDSFLTRGQKLDQPFHINKKCILSDGVLSNDFSRVKCQVFRLLRNHGELKELFACGFYSKNIIGYKPSNLNSEFKPLRAHEVKPTEPSSSADITYIFNNESFTCERLVHAERCRGCTNQVIKEAMALRHREQVPREKLAETPFVSQFYHTEHDCLTKRGFTRLYLERANCNVILSGSDNLQQVRDCLVRCGFASNNLAFSTADVARQRALSPGEGSDKVTSESYLFIVNCPRSRLLCDGCRLNIAVNGPCFLYGQQCIADNKARFFHISKPCLNNHFTNSQLSAMICINNDSAVPVSPMTVVQCGILNIMTAMPARSRPHCERPRFVVDTSLDISGQCFACHQPLKRDLFVLRALGRYLPVNMHLAASCVAKSGYLPPQLADCELTFAVQLSPQALSQLDQCGFKKLPLQ